MRTVLTNFYEDGWDLGVLADIRHKTDAYAVKHELIDCTIIQVFDNSKVDEANNRYDIDVVYKDAVTGRRTRAKLLYMKGDVVDGEEFHKRYEEFYGDRTDMQVV